MQMQQSGSYTNLTSSGAIAKVPGTLIGFYVNSTSSGTIALTDGGSGGTTVSGTITPSVGWNTFPAAFVNATGPYATIGGTINVTFIFAAGG